jgi:hypothetical protein
MRTARARDGICRAAAFTRIFAAHPRASWSMGDHHDRFRDAFNRVEALIERRYGLPVVITDVPHPFTGDLDGAVIHVDYDLDAEEALFVLVHLFGHTVQWNVSPDDRALGLLEVRDASPELLERLARYEEIAARYSLCLFHEAGVNDLDQWLSDFAACDIAYLLHFYRTGEKREFRSFWRDGCPLLTALEIPAFQPTKWVTRSGTVI